MTDKQLWALWDSLPVKTPLALARAAIESIKQGDAMNHGILLRHVQALRGIRIRLRQGETLQPHEQLRIAEVIGRILVHIETEQAKESKHETPVL